ncbi:MAG: alpha/beta hydrolase [Bacteroidales bacterium]|nr:alpha/beta hydrolase [Bacteroidales bacterium]
MRNIKFTYLLFLFAVFHFHADAQIIMHIQSFDGEVIEGRLNIPSDNFKQKIVIDVPGSGPFTYETKRKLGRKVFNYHDYFAGEFNKRGMAYFSYSTRYTEPDSAPPHFDRVNKEKFYNYRPAVKIKDLEEIIKFLQKDQRLANCEFILLGWSSGSIIASEVANRELVPVDALFLAGAPSDDVYSTILWQHSGESSMINMRRFFDSDQDGIIQPEEYENGHPSAKARVGGAKFEQLDINHDSVLTTEDFRIKLKPRLQKIRSAIEENNSDWIWNNFFRVGVPWITDHRELEPNKTRLLKLDIPVHIFHGSDDANAPVEDILALEKKAKDLKKSNLHFYIFQQSNHSLDFPVWVLSDSIPHGLKTLFDTAEKL